MLQSAPDTVQPIEPIQLSPVERILWRVEEAFSGAFRVAILIRLDGCMEADLLGTALHNLQQRHPKLRAAIVKADDGHLRYHFEQVAPSIPVAIIDFGKGASPWREEVRRLMQAAFPAGGPLAAVTVLQSRSDNTCELILTVHHAIADGVSAIMLVEDLLTEYSRAETDSQAAPRPALPVVVATRAKGSSGWLNRFRLVQRFIRLQREEGRGRQTVLPDAQNIPPQSQWVHWVFSQEETLALIRQCRREQVSVASALVGAAFCGLMDCLPVSSALFKCTFPFDLREALEGSAGPITPQDLGSFASIMNEYYEVPQQPELWDLARRAHRNHQKFVRLGGPTFYYNVAAAAGIYDKAVMKRRHSAQTSSKAQRRSSQRVTLLATNYGVTNILNSYGSLRTTACTLTCKNDVTGPLLVLEALVLGGRLNIGFAADSLNPVFWDQLQVAVRRNLDSAIARRPLG